MTNQTINTPPTTGTDTTSSPTDSSVGLSLIKLQPATAVRRRRLRPEEKVAIALALPLGPMWDLFDRGLVDDRIAGMILYRWDNGIITQENIVRVVRMIIDGYGRSDPTAPPPPLTLVGLLKRYVEYRDWTNLEEKWSLMREAQRFGADDLYRKVGKTTASRRTEIHGFRLELAERKRAAVASGPAGVTPPPVEEPPSEQSV